MRVGRAVRQCIMIALVIGGPPVITYMLTHPDSVVRVRMRLLLAVKDGANAQADFWHAVSGKAATAYQRARL